MNMFENKLELNAKAKLTLALCTVLALSMAPLRADDSTKDKSQSQGAPGSETSSQSGKLSRMDEKFVRDAAKGGAMEVQMGRIGVQRAQNPAVKQLAQRIVDDHTKANAELRQLASSKGITLPDADRVASTGTSTSSGTAIGTTTESDRTQVRDKSDPSSKSHGEHAEATKKLEGLSGTEFDRAFVKASVTHHEKAVKEFEKASQSAEDQELKAFAAKTLPTLREHLSQAQGLQAQVGATGAPGDDSGTDTGKSKQDNSEPPRQQN